MSKTLREYPSLDLGGDYSHDMSITAFVGGLHGSSVQFTIGGLYCALAENQVRDLRDALTKRLLSRKGYRATEWGEPITVEPVKKPKEVSNAKP